MEKVRLALYFGNRGFFPGELIADARRELAEAVSKKEVEARLSALENPKEEVKKVNKKTKKDESIVLGTKDDDIFVFEG